MPAPPQGLFTPPLMSVILLILPDFLLIALGWLLLHRLGFDRTFFDGAEKLVYFVLFPALLFHSITRTPLSLGNTTVLMAATIGVMLGGIVLAWLGRLIVRPDPAAHASVAQCGFRFNTYLALSLAGGLPWPGAQTTMAVLVGFAVPISNIGAVHALASRHGGNALREIARNPYILATLAALACNFLRVPIPHVLDVALGRLGACALAIGLLCVGATLSLRGGRAHAPLMAWMVAAKLVLLPPVALILAWALGLSAGERLVLVLFSALPTASSAHVLAARMGGDGRLVAVTMSIGTLLSAVTLPLWLDAVT
ncbi:AEC family transporter [Castellaniella denitrificans]|jgi:predicted permease|uniref:AEC family transporter n=1 Tax=Castellaniella denitrificans TaxID=56119 RepID=A0ABT4M383_9BURK|nr:AEC family transporter [Castellaniella denitrificans]MCZ4329746.1 AEC family transporter [Castellaniella denitrificans]